MAKAKTKAKPETKAPMLKPKLFLPVNGILTSQRRDSWVDVFDCIALQLNQRSVAYEYFTTASIRMFAQNKFVEDYSDLLREYKNFKLICVGHSNGCDIIVQALQKSQIRVEEIHLIAGAVEHDFYKNGLNQALNDGLVGKVYIYASERDGVLKWLARIPRFLLGKLWYGYMGWIGAVNFKELMIDPAVIHRVRLVERDYTHTQWIHGVEGQALFSVILKGVMT